MKKQKAVGPGTISRGCLEQDFVYARDKLLKGRRCPNYFDVGVIVYGGSDVGSGFGGALSGDVVHPISAIGHNPVRIEERSKKVDDGAGGIIEQKTKFPIWFDPKAQAAHQCVDSRYSDVGIGC